MAKKKKSRDSVQSKGERNNVNKSLLKSLRREYRASNLDVINNKMDAHLKLRNVVLTVPNPNKNETNKRFIKIPAKEVWGDPKRKGFVMNFKEAED